MTIRIDNWNLKTFEKIRRSSGVQDLVNTVTEGVAAECNAGLTGSSKFEALTTQGKSRYRGIVVARGFRARRVELTENRMTKVAFKRGMKISGND